MSERGQSLIAEFNAAAAEEAFAALVRQHVNLVFATALRQVGDAGAAEEITQNGLRGGWRRPPANWARPDYRRWLHQTALNKSREWLRSAIGAATAGTGRVNLELARAEGFRVVVARAAAG